MLSSLYTLAKSMQRNRCITFLSSTYVYSSEHAILPPKGMAILTVENITFLGVTGVSLPL